MNCQYTSCDPFFFNHQVFGIATFSHFQIDYGVTLKGILKQHVFCTTICLYSPGPVPTGQKLAEEVNKISQVEHIVVICFLI